ncbi:MAG: Do family serine endopeptidase [Polyangiaceae bacterium]
MRRSVVLVLPLLLALGACKTSATTMAADTSKKSSEGQASTPAAAPFANPVQTGQPDVAALVAKVQPAVVNVIAEPTVKRTSNNSFPQFPFDFFGGGRGGRGGGDDEPQSFKSQSQGSGFIIDKEGHVVTNAHVVDGVDTVRIKLTDERELKAKVRGRDPKMDLALLQIEGGGDFPAAALGASDSVRVGEYAIAMGNPLGLGHTVTMGIVSAKSRTIGAGPYDDFIQTDASINPGNSGGPLFNLKGEVIGINTAIINPQRAQNIGFAIPVDALKEVLPQLLAKGSVSRGRLGVFIQPVDSALAKALGMDKPKGALVGEVERGGPGDRIGIRSGDVIVSVDGEQVNHSQELPRIVAKHAPGSKVDVKVLRDKQTLSLSATLDELKDKDSASDDKDGANDPKPGAAPSSALGVSLEDAPNGGAIVRRVAPDGRAEGALVPGDVIVEVNRAKIASAADVVKALKDGKNASGPILLKVQRQGHLRFVAIDR